MRPLDRFRRSAFTGDGRCWACTVTNGVLLAVGVATLWRVASIPAAVLVGVAGGLVCGGHTGPGETPSDVLACQSCDARIAMLPGTECAPRA